MNWIMNSMLRFHLWTWWDTNITSVGVSWSWELGLLILQNFEKWYFAACANVIVIQFMLRANAIRVQSVFIMVLTFFLNSIWFVYLVCFFLVLFLFLYCRELFKKLSLWLQSYHFYKGRSFRDGGCSKEVWARWDKSGAGKAITGKLLLSFTSKYLTLLGWDWLFSILSNKIWGRYPTWCYKRI